MTTSMNDGGTDSVPPGALGADIGYMPANWDLEADVVVIGAGASGLPAAIKASEEGASVLVIEANYDVGGHAIVSGGNVPLGGGTSVQRQYGIQDSPDTVFADLTDWSVVQPNGWPDYRYNDRGVIRAFADHSVPTYEFLVAHGVKFKEVPPDNAGAHNTGNSAPRENHAIWTDGAGLGSPGGRNGAGLIRPLEASARAKGVKFLLNYKMTRLIRAASPESAPGRVIGMTAQYTPRLLPGATAPLQSYRSEGNIETSQPTMTIRARKAVILATGGNTSNVNFRRMFDPRLTEVYQVGGEPYTFQDASGELAAMGIGASLWGLGNQMLENGATIRAHHAIGTRYNMAGAMLEATVARYNGFVEAGIDADFGKSRPPYKIQTPPFYAAWATPNVHDTRAGLRINAKCQVMDIQGQVIPGLYCGGESAGGFNQHGLGRCTAQGYIAGTYAAEEHPQA